MRPHSVKLPEHLDDLLDRLAKQRGVSRSAIIREAVQAYAAAPRTGPSALSLAGGLAGSLEGPRDLSANAKHLKGFGE